MTSLAQILLLLLNIAQFIIIVHVIASWLINFQVLNLRQPFVAQLWQGLNVMVEPVYSRIRRFLPMTPGLDLAPLVAFIALIILQRALLNNAGFFYSY